MNVFLLFSQRENLRSTKTVLLCFSNRQNRTKSNSQTSCTNLMNLSNIAKSHHTTSNHTITPPQALLLPSNQLKLTVIRQGTHARGSQTEQRNENGSLHLWREKAQTHRETQTQSKLSTLRCSRTQALTVWCIPRASFLFFQFGEVVREPPCQRMCA